MTRPSLRRPSDKTDEKRLILESSEVKGTEHPGHGASATTMGEQYVFEEDPVTLHTVRWRPQSSTEERFVAPEKANLLRGINTGDVDRIKMQLQSGGGMDLHNAEDEYGVSALEHAVRSGSTAIVDELLSVCTHAERSNAIERALLFAIRTNDISMADHLITLHIQEGFCRRPHTVQVPGKNKSDEDCPDITEEEGVQLRRRNNRKWSQPRTLSTNSLIDETEFSQEMTPIVMAAQLERTEIIRMLIDRCCPDIHPLTRPPKTDHDRQKCYICKEPANFVGRQTIEECRKAIEVYKALSSPAYMFQAGVDDPILEAFIISDIMERRKLVDPAFVNDYDAISTKCRKLAVDMLDLCRTYSETVALLSYDAGIKATHAFHEASFPRIMVAAHYQQKEFIAHANCQQVLQNLWYSGLPEWVCQTSMHQLRAVTYSILLGLSMPILFLLSMVRAPYVDRLVKPPVSKFIFDMFSFSVFLALLYLNSLIGKNHTRGGPLTVTEVLIFIYVIAYTTRFLRQTIRRRTRLFENYNVYNTTWRFYELLMLLLFLTYFGIKIGLWIETIVTKRLDVTDDRRTWAWYDPFLWCEAFYACACVLAVTQLYSFFKASSVLGPLQISMKSMIYDVGPFLLLFSIVLAAFAIGLHSLYAGYPGMQQVDPVTQQVVTQPEAFVSLGNSFKTLFWDLFGYGGPENAEVVVSAVNTTRVLDNGTVVGEVVSQMVSHDLTEHAGYMLYGVYHIVVIIVLLNMVIAMMANSYNRIEGNAVTEWRFARTRLILTYLNEIGIMAPPFNVFPIPIRWILGKLFGRFQKCTPCRSTSTKPMSYIPYPELIERLSKRYWRMREAEARRQEVTTVPHPSFPSCDGAVNDNVVRRQMYQKHSGPAREKRSSDV